MKICGYVFIVWLVVWADLCSSQSLYNEEYRPQFHFSPSSGWIGDPCGLIKFENKFHMFWWGHAESTDLVFWNQQVQPMRGDDGTFAYFTGSVVVDKNNTSGFGGGIKPPMVAIYTGHNKVSGIQDQRISYSTDYEIFNYYSGNPVLDIGSKEFRDPDVFWHQGTNRWIMGITLPIERKITFYASGDLKSWEFLSTFGPIGAQEQVWEVPQLLQLPLDGDVNNRKWTMICSIGPNKIQYFTGNFDGTRFTIDPQQESYLKNGTGIEGETFEDFENGYGNWIVEGSAFGTKPASGSLPNQMNISGYFGNGLVNSYLMGDPSTGKLTSEPFAVEQKYINFLVGGGDNPLKSSINLVVNGSVVKSSTGGNSEVLKWNGWDVSELNGQEARIEIIDSNTGGWGHINVDHIMFSNVLMNTDREHASWIDWGADFYAARAFRNFDDDEMSTPVVWLGWLGNWEYANQVPTSWGRGAESIPRELWLKSTATGFDLIQKPIQRLENIRDEAVEIIDKQIDGTYKLSEIELRRNTYELEATFVVKDSAANFGLNLFSSAAGRVILGFDAKSSTVYLDRRNVGDNSFSPLFAKISTAPIQYDSTIKFHVFVDQSSIEVFINEGETVFTSSVFPYSGSTGLELFSLKGSAPLQKLKVWPLKSIWGVEPPSVTGVDGQKKNDCSIFPNPLAEGHEITIDLPDGMLHGDELFDFCVLDSNGRLMYQKTSLRGHQVTANVQLNQGFYIVKLQSKKSNYCGKLIVN